MFAMRRAPPQAEVVLRTMIAEREASNSAMARRTRAASRMWLTSYLAVGVVALVVAGCGPVRLVATSHIPTPLVVKIPVAVAVSVPREFSEYVHKEERAGTKWEISLGKAQAEGLTRLLNAMFDRVISVDDINAGAAQAGQGIRAILEPSVEEYAFVTPRDAGSPFYAVSIKYRLNIYTPQGRLADSWSFTGYGTAPSKGMSSDEPLNAATSLALRDAGAKLAVEFRDQAIVRGLIPETAPESPLPLEGAAKPVVATTPEERPAEAGAQPSTTPESKQDAAQPAAAPPQPEGAKSEEAESAEARPAEAKPSETQPPEAQLPETKPPETKLPETTPEQPNA